MKSVALRDWETLWVCPENGLENLSELLAFYSKCQMPPEIAVEILSSGFPQCIIESYSTLINKSRALECLVFFLRQPEESFMSFTLLNSYVGVLFSFTTDQMKSLRINTDEADPFIDLLYALKDQLDTSSEIGMYILEPWIEAIFVLTRRNLSKRTLIEAPLLVLRLIKFWCVYPKGTRAFSQFFSNKAEAIYDLIVVHFIKNQKHLEYDGLATFPIPSVGKEKIRETLTQVGQMLIEECDSTVLDIYAALFQCSLKDHCDYDVFNNFISIAKVQSPSQALGRLFRCTIFHPQRENSEHFLGFIVYFYNLTVDYPSLIDFALGTPAQLSTVIVDSILEDSSSNLLDICLLLELYCSCSSSEHLRNFLDTNEFTPQVALILIKSSRSKWQFIQSILIKRIFREIELYNDELTNLTLVDELLEQASKYENNPDAYEIFDLTIFFLEHTTEQSEDILTKEFSIIKKLLTWQNLNLALVELYRGPLFTEKLNSILEIITDGQFNYSIILQMLQTLLCAVELYPTCIRGINEEVLNHLASFQEIRSKELSFISQKIIVSMQNLNEMSQ